MGNKATATEVIEFELRNLDVRLSAALACAANEVQGFLERLDGGRMSSSYIEQQIAELGRARDMLVQRETFKSALKTIKDTESA